MRFLLDTDICSAHMRRPAKLAHRVVQYTALLAISTVTLAELYAGAYKHSQSHRLLNLIGDLVREVRVLSFDSICAEIRAGSRYVTAARDFGSDSRPDDRIRRSGA